MTNILKDFDLKKEVKDLLDCYCNPPFNWTVNRLGIYKYNDKLESFCCYNGEGTAEPIYNGSAKYVIDLLEVIEEYFNPWEEIKKLPKEDLNERYDNVYEYTIDKIELYEE